MRARFSSSLFSVAAVGDRCSPQRRDERGDFERELGEGTSSGLNTAGMLFNKRHVGCHLGNQSTGLSAE